MFGAPHVPPAIEIDSRRHVGCRGRIEFDAGGHVGCPGHIEIDPRGHIECPHDIDFEKSGHMTWSKAIEFEKFGHVRCSVAIEFEKSGHLMCDFGSKSMSMGHVTCDPRSKSMMPGHVTCPPAIPRSRGGTWGARRRFRDREWARGVPISDSAVARGRTECVSASLRSRAGPSRGTARFCVRPGAHPLPLRDSAFVRVRVECSRAILRPTLPVESCGCYSARRDEGDARRVFGAAARDRPRCASDHLVQVRSLARVDRPLPAGGDRISHDSTDRRACHRPLLVSDAAVRWTVAARPTQALATVDRRLRSCGTGTDRRSKRPRHEPAAQGCICGLGGPS